MRAARPACAAPCTGSAVAGPSAMPRRRYGADSPNGETRSVLELVDLSKHFGGVKAVDGVSLNVAKGEIFGLIGPNGSGKSTIVNLIAGLIAPTCGRIVVDAEDMSDLAA